MKKFLFILTNQPYNGTDNAYNALRLAKTLKEKGEEVRIFLMNDAVDLARNSTKKPEKLRSLSSGTVLNVCGSCQTRCGLHAAESYFEAW
ncbi:DsrE/DsrF/TusD sulfur relay family protein [Campylobacter concisus]|uniref:DsrE/DsrF/TusD sulfur relay family protein n=1 Tax=Campylobacter concisus TaxID=199 RepID=UPI00122D153C|nr:DsrE family protein [Campylobacter concisus]